MKLMILYTWDGCLRDSLEIPKWSQATCSVWCGSRDGYGTNAREIYLISIWFGVQQNILHSLGDIIFLLVLWQGCWGLSGGQSRKSRLLMCLIWKTQLLCTQCLGIWPRLAATGPSMGFLELCQEPGVYSPVMAGMSIRTWSLFSEFRTPDSIWRTTYECKLGLAGQYWCFWMWSSRSGLLFCWQSDIGIPINFQEESGFVTFWSFQIRVPLKVSRHVRNVSRWGGHLGVSLGSPQQIHTSLHLLQWKTSLHSSHCREIWPSFESGHLGIHSTWGSKLRVLLTLLLLREEFS